MKWIFFACVVLFTVSCATSKTNKNEINLNGTWEPIKQEIGGKALPAIVFEKQLLIINDTNYTVMAESVDKGVAKYAGNKMDIYGKEGANAGKNFTAIYKYEMGQLTICYNLLGNEYPVSFETNGKPMYFLSVFKKQVGK